MTKNLTNNDDESVDAGGLFIEALKAITPKGEVREKIDQDLAERLLINKPFIDDIFEIRRVYLEKQRALDYDEHMVFDEPFGATTEEMQSLKTETLGFIEEIMYHERGHAYQQDMSPEQFIGDHFPEDVELEIREDIFNLIRKYKLPFHFYTWLVELIDTGKKPKTVPTGWWFKLPRIENYLEMNTGITTSEKKQFVRDIVQFIHFLEYKNAQATIIQKYKEFEKYLRKKLQKAKGSSRRKKRLNPTEVKKQIQMVNEKYGFDGVNQKDLIHNSKSIALENFDSGYDKSVSGEPTEPELKKASNRFRKMKSNLIKIP